MKTSGSDGSSRVMLGDTYQGITSSPGRGSSGHSNAETVLTSRGFHNDPAAAAAGLLLDHDPDVAMQRGEESHKTLD